MCSSRPTVRQERIQEMADRLPTYYGIIKNFHHDRGLGFIECDETKDVYEKDILVLRSQLGEQVEGAVVSFNIVEDARGVKAANVKICPEGFPPGKEPKPRPPKGKGKGKGKEFGKDGKGFGKDAKGFGKGKGKFEQLWNVATNMLNEWGWWGNDSWDGGWEDPWWPGGNGDWQGQEGKGPGDWQGGKGLGDWQGGKGPGDWQGGKGPGDWQGGKGPGDWQGGKGEWQEGKGEWPEGKGDRFHPY